MIPRKGKPGKDRQAAEHRPAFRRTVKWRTGSEGRISTLKRGYGWDRTRLDGTEGARIWTGHGILAPQPRQDRRPGQLATQQSPGVTNDSGPHPARSQPSEFFRSK